MPLESKMGTWSLGVIAVVYVLANPQGRAVAQDKAGSNRVAIADVTFEGALPAEAQRVFKERLAEGLTKGDVELRARKKAWQSPSCTDSACFRRVAQELNVAYLVVGKVAENQKNYEIDLELFSGVTGRSAGNHHQRCQICGLSEATERMSLAASALTEKLKSLLREPGHVVIRTQAAGAVVTVNGQTRGPAPQEVTLPAGKHAIKLECKGFRAVERDIEVVPAVDQELLIEMVGIPSDVPYATAGWLALGTGVALVAAGVVAFTVFHGQEVTCDVSTQDMHGNCKKIKSATWVGAGLIAAGVAASTVGGFWLYLDSQQERPRSTALHLGWQGRF